MSNKTVFVIHGRDLEVRDAVVRFLKALDLEVIDFEKVAATLGPSPFIAEVVFKAIRSADAIIALFTPDEHAALYEPKEPDRTFAEPQETRWQARSNVIFEAGVALGSKPECTILAALSTDTRAFSDLQGKHFVDLASANAKEQLRGRLMGILFPHGSPERQRGLKMGTKKFDFAPRKCWGFYDEIHLLANRMRHHMVGSGATPPSLLDIVSKVVREKPPLIAVKVRPADFMRRVERLFPQHVNDTYWWLVVFGFFRFIDDEDWGITEDEDWKDSARCVEWAERGVALVRRIQIGGSEG